MYTCASESYLFLTLLALYPSIDWLLKENLFLYCCTCKLWSYEAAAAGRFLIANRLHSQLLEFIPHVSTNLLSYQPDVIFNYRFYLNFYQKFRGDGKISKLSCIFFDCIKTCKNWVHMYTTGTFQIINKFIHLSNLQQNKFILGKHQIKFFLFGKYWILSRQFSMESFQSGIRTWFKPLIVLWFQMHDRFRVTRCSEGFQILTRLGGDIGWLDLNSSTV